MPAKYLSAHAESEIAVASELPACRNVVVVPCCDESADFVDGLLPAAGDDSLCIVVVNGSTAHDDDVHRSNAACLQALTSRANAKPLSTAHAALGRIEQMPLLLIDRASEGRRLPPKRGVGLARKIGCDVACALYHAGKLDSRFIHWTDCDVTLPAGYFAAATRDDAVLLSYPFRHVPSGDAALDHAHAVYEIFLRYYVLGLRHAGSPYALHTIGSCLAVDAQAYAKVRGVPPRDAAEDFYFVNKVAKLGRAVGVDCAPIAIRARHSARVPFGTGRAAADIVATGGARAVYDPRVFDQLKTWLDAMLRMAAEGDTDARFAPPLAGALASLGYPNAFRDALAGAPAARRVERAHEWFDAFKTRKLVHALRDAGLPDLPWREALAAARFIRDDASVGEPLSIAGALFQLE